MATAIYIDGRADALDYSEIARTAFLAAGYEPQTYLGATVRMANSNIGYELSKDTLKAEVIVLRFGNGPLEDHWAFSEIERLKNFGGLLVAVLDATNPWVKLRLDGLLGTPCFLIDSPSGLEATLAAALPKASSHRI